MWQIIGASLPTTTPLEWHRFIDVVKEAMPTSANERKVVDLGLWFLSILTEEEVLTVLEERRDLVVDVQTLLVNRGEHDEPEWSGMQLLMQDHIQTLLEAELAWLDRARHRLRGSGNTHVAVKREKVMSTYEIFERVVQKYL
jgi:hypothetical protein